MTFKTPEDVRAYNREWYAKHKNKDPTYRKRLYAANVGVLRERARKKRWAERGLPIPTRPCPQECESCGNKPAGNRVLHLDHDHVTGQFRGWLCWKCNSAIGKLGDSIEGVQRALNYLTATSKVPPCATKF